MLHSVNVERKILLVNVIRIAQVFASLGHWNTAVMVILALHLGPIWMVRFIIIIIVIIIIITIIAIPSDTT